MDEQNPYLVKAEAAKKATAIGAAPKPSILRQLAAIISPAIDPDFEPGVADLAMTALPILGGLKKVRAFHGSPKDFDTFRLPDGRRERAIFLSSSEDDARAFGEMRGGDPPRMYETALNPDDLSDVRYADFSDGDPLYTPETMERILDDAQRGGTKGVRIRGVQNFEGGRPSTTYAVFDPQIIDILKKYGVLGAIAPPAVLAQEAIRRQMDGAR